MLYLFLIAAFLTFAALPLQQQIDLGMSQSNLIAALYYPFLHTSWLHLLINIFSLAMLWHPAQKLWAQRFEGIYWIPRQRAFMRLRLFIYTYTGAVLAALITANNTPTIGASGLVFYLLGMILLLNPTKQQLINYIPILLAVILQFFIGNSNVMLHIVAFIIGAISVIIKQTLTKITNRT